MKRKIAAILAADIAGYSRLVAEDEEETLRRLEAYRSVFDDFVARYGGRIFNTAGDAVMCAFESAVEATRCAIDIQESLRTRNMAYPQSRRMEFRIGISIGDVVEREGDLLGDGVNIAARLEGLARPGGICISRSVHEAVTNKVSVPFVDIGEREVKNIPNPVHAFLVAWPGEEVVATPPGPQGKATLSAGAGGNWMRERFSLVAAGIVTIALAGGVGLIWQSRQGAAPEKAAETAPRIPVVGNGQKRVDADLPAAEAFAALARQGGLVADPVTIAEHYHNARLLEARGDSAGARRTYQTLLALKPDRIDPYLRYAALLRAQDGRAGARVTIGELATDGPAQGNAAPMASLAHALQFDGSERRRRVEAFAETHPAIGLAQYLVAEEYSENRLGAQTLHDRRREHQALETFLAEDRAGRLSGHFLDASVLASWLDQARKRHQALAAFLSSAATVPSAQFMRSNQGWMAAVSLPEAATEIGWRIGADGDFRPTGTLPHVDQRTGKPMANPSFELPADLGEATLFVRYADADGRLSGPFQIPFSPRKALSEQARDTLERFSNGWIAFNERLVYFTQLISYRCAVAEARLGFGDGPLDVKLPLPACDERNPYAIPANSRPYLTAPAGTGAVRVQITYTDGSQSEVKTFRR